MSALDSVLNTQAALEKAQPELKKLSDACQGMEAAFLKTLVTQMRKGTGEVHFGQQFGGEIYRDMFDGQLASMLAEKEGAGLARTMSGPMAKQVLNKYLLQNKEVK